MRLRIAAFLGAFTIVWAVRVAVHWGYCYCDYCLAKCASWIYLQPPSSSRDNEELETGQAQHKQNRFTITWPHCAVLLFLVGQIMLEDPSAAYVYHNSGQIDQFVLGGALRKWQSAGCACMTFAILLLVDHCHRSGAASTEASTSSMPSGCAVEAHRRIDSNRKAAMNHSANPGPGKFLAMALASCW